MFYYISDIHFGCTNIYEKRELSKDEEIVKKWNQKIHNDDTVYILGDIARFGTNKENEYACSVISRLKGNKVLIIGNHDQKGLKDNRIKQLFTEIVDNKKMVDPYGGLNQKVYLSHYPIFTWDEAYSGRILIYGHTHNNFDDVLYQESLEKLREKVRELNQEEGIKKFKSEPYAYNVGIMKFYMNDTPMTLKEIIENIGKKG